MIFFFPVALNFLIISRIAPVCLRGSFFGKPFAEPVPAASVIPCPAACCRRRRCPEERAIVAALALGSAPPAAPAARAAAPEQPEDGRRSRRSGPCSGSPALGSRAHGWHWRGFGGGDVLAHPTSPKPTSEQKHTSPKILFVASSLCCPVFFVRRRGRVPDVTPRRVTMVFAKQYLSVIVVVREPRQSD